jgi:hypothetical protein
MDQSPLGLLAQLEAARNNLSRSEARVADYILNAPQSVLELSIEALSTAAGVSEPTVARFCKSVGFSGWKDFKIQMARSLGGGIPIVHQDVRAPYRDPDIIKQTLVAVAANPSPDIFNEICQQETFRSHTIAHARSSMGDRWFPRKAVVGRYLAIVKSGQFSDLAVTAQWGAVCRVNSANS